MTLAKTHKDKHDEYYTPVNLIQMAKDCLGSIDLDPATCQTALDLLPQELRPELFYTIENPAPAIWPIVENVWCNPPFSKTRDFISSAKAACEFGTSTMFLMPANMSTIYIQKIFTDLADEGLLSPVLFHQPRVYFFNGKKNQVDMNPPGSTCLFIIGNRRLPIVQRKIAKFVEWGNRNNHLMMEAL